jgi:biotin carboxylase
MENARGNVAKTILCIASQVKGEELVRECKRRGWQVIMLTTTEQEHAAEWPRESIDEFFFMPAIDNVDHVTNAVSYLSRSRVIDHIIPLHDLDVGPAAALREHLRLPGMGTTQTRFFRDKLAMRMRAQEAGIAVPDFTPIFNYDALRDFMQRVPSPWLVKPRFEGGSLGIKRVFAEHELWPILDGLGDDQSFHLMERYVTGAICHVDSIVANGKVVLAQAHQYGRPLLDVVQQGGLFTSQSVQPKSKDERALKKLNQQVLKTMGLVNGVSHTEFIKGEDGELYFLETSARVGGANISDLVEATTGVNLWREWARLETLAEGETYSLPETRQQVGGIIISLARQERPDMSGYNDPEIVWKISKPWHAGMIVISSDHARISQLLDEYSRRFYQDFFTSLPPQYETAQHVH